MMMPMAFTKLKELLLSKEKAGVFTAFSRKSAKALLGKSLPVVISKQATFTLSRFLDRYQNTSNKARTSCFYSVGFAILTVTTNVI